MLRVFWDTVTAVDPTAKLDESRMALCRAGELEAFWKQGALTDVEERPLDFAMRIESFPDYWEPFLLGQGPTGAYARSADASRRQALRAEAKRILAITDENAPFSLPARAWAVRGTVAR